MVLTHSNRGDKWSPFRAFLRQCLYKGCVLVLPPVVTHFADPDALSSIIPNTKAAIHTTAMTKTPVPTSNTVFPIFVKGRVKMV